MDKKPWMLEEDPMPHKKLCKIPHEMGDVLRHLEQLWNEVQVLKREVMELKRKSDGVD